MHILVLYVLLLVLHEHFLNLLRFPNNVFPTKLEVHLVLLMLLFYIKCKGEKIAEIALVLKCDCFDLVERQTFFCINLSRVLGPQG